MVQHQGPQPALLAELRDRAEYAGERVESAQTTVTEWMAGSGLGGVV